MVPSTIALVEETATPDDTGVGAEVVGVPAFLSGDGAEEVGAARSFDCWHGGYHHHHHHHGGFRYWGRRTARRTSRVVGGRIVPGVHLILPLEAKQPTQVTLAACSMEYFVVLLLVCSSLLVNSSRYI
jgi:hypothetical protein